MRRVPAELPDLLTVASVPQIAAALAHASTALGLGLDRRDVCLLLAQVAFETGLGKAMHRWNLGNAKHVDGDGRDWCSFACTEIIGGREVWFFPPATACRFRAFRSLDEGAVDYLAMMRRSFRSAWPALLSGDPVAFVSALKAAHYFTADVGLYTRGVTSLFASFLARLPADLATTPMPWTDADELAVAELCPGNARTLTSVGVCMPAGVDEPELVAHDDQAPTGDALACYEDAVARAVADLEAEPLTLPTGAVA